MALHRRTAEDQLLLTDSRIREVEIELEERPKRESALKDAEERVKSIRESLNIREKLLDKQRQTAAYLKQEQKSLVNTEENLKRTS